MQHLMSIDHAFSENFKRKIAERKGFFVKVDYSRDELLSEFGKITLRDRYLRSKEKTPQDRFAEVAICGADDAKHAQRLYDYMSKLWFMPATPVLTNMDRDDYFDRNTVQQNTTKSRRKGLPISCFLNEVEDSLDGIVQVAFNENVWLASNGGGIGTYWGNVRSMGESVHGSGKSSGSIPFIVAQNGISLAVSQGLLRRGSVAVYKPVWHPEIEEFIEIRRPTGGDPSRKALNLHHGVVITDDFMNAVEQDLPWELKSPKNGAVVAVIKARDLWIRILTARIETGEPYLLFIDNVNNMAPEVYKRNGLKIKTSNLCSEITLATGPDQFGNVRTAICCLSSVNLEHFDEWSQNNLFIEDIMRFLDNILDDFAYRAPEQMHRAVYSAMRERSVGLGAMGWHSFLQSKMIPMESAIAKSWNKRIFSHIKERADDASVKLAHERGACPDAADVGLMERFANKIAIAPTASISIIAGGASPGIDPISDNAFTQKTLSGSYNIRNRYLSRLLDIKGMNDDEIWSSIINNNGSVAHLEFLTENEKAVFKTAFEIDQNWIIDFAADRTQYVCQAQSVNLFMPGNVHKKVLHKVHFNAWKKGVKSNYYLRSKSMQRADKVSTIHEKHITQLEMDLISSNSANKKADDAPLQYDECLACQ